MRSRNESSRPKRKKGVAIIGLGYVGLPLACLASEKGWKVFGIAKHKDKIEQINSGVCPIPDKSLSRWLKQVKVFATDDYAVVQRASVVVICVPTPVDASRNPDLGPIRSVCHGISRYLSRGQTIIVESTVNPGVCEEVVIPLLEQSGLTCGKDFFVAHCPERIDPGNKKWNVRNIPRVIGATDARGANRAKSFYESILEAPLTLMKSIREAEAVKILENSFRDVNIAFVNEIAQSFDRLGIDTLEVIEAARTKPFAFLAHYPSVGIGGHCIPVDPYYLIKRAQQSGFDHKFLKLAREINNNMPSYAVQQLVLALNQRRIAISAVTVGILGIAYKANIADTRESPAYKVMSILKHDYNTKYETFDPHLPHESTVPTLDELFNRCRALILVTNHREFGAIDAKLLKRKKILAVVDGQNAWDRQAFLAAGIAYRGIGR